MLCNTLILLAILVAGPDLSGEPIVMSLAVALVYAPRISRISRSAALDVILSDYVLVARLRGENALSINGSGIGFSLISIIIKLHSGKIKIDSEIGVGTKIKIYFKKELF